MRSERRYEGRRDPRFVAVHRGGRLDAAETRRLVHVLAATMVVGHIGGYYWAMRRFTVGLSGSLWYLGRPESVFAQVNHLRPERFPKVEDTSIMILHYPKGVGLFEGSWDLPRGFQDLEVFGLDGSLMVTRERVELRKANHTQDVPLEPLTAKPPPPASRRPAPP